MLIRNAKKYRYAVNFWGGDAMALMNMGLAMVVLMLGIISLQIDGMRSSENVFVSGLLVLAFILCVIVGGLLAAEGVMQVLQMLYVYRATMGY